MKVAIGIVVVALLACGCGKEEPTVKTFNTGAMVRLVNLTDKELNAKFGMYSSTSCLGWSQSVFMRCPPKDIEVEFTGGGVNQKVPIKLEPSTRYSFYGVQRNGKVEIVTVKDDPKDAEEAKVAFRAISFADGDVDIVVKPAAGEPLESKGMKSGEPSKELSSTPQTFTVTAMSGGKSIGETTVEALAKETYTIAVTGGAKPELKVMLNNPPMKASAGGASAAG